MANDGLARDSVEEPDEALGVAGRRPSTDEPGSGHGLPRPMEVLTRYVLTPTGIVAKAAVWMSSATAAGFET